MKYTKLLLMCSISLVLGGCAAAHTMISKRNLDVQTKMTDTIFLNPVDDAQKTVYVQIKNTSDKSGFNIEGKIRNALENKGYTVVNSLNKAYYLVQANILQVGKIDPSAAEKSFAGGYGSFVRTTGTGVVTGALLSNGRGHGMLAGGLVGGLVDTVANAVVKDVTYTVITDLQISEKAARGAKIEQTDESNLKQGSSSSSKQTSTSQTSRMKYQTRVMSTANKANLSFKDAQPVLEEGLANSIAGIF